MPYLEHLYLNDNHIEEIKSFAFSNLVSLKQLVLTDNKLTKVYKKTFRDLNQLEILELGSNRITDIENYSFETNTSLAHLNLRNNKITSICKKTFKGITSVEGILLDSDRKGYRKTVEIEEEPYRI